MVKAVRLYMSNLAAQIYRSASVRELHCVFESEEDGTVSLTTNPECVTMVNGRRLEANKVRHHNIADMRLTAYASRRS